MISKDFYYIPILEDFDPFGMGANVTTTPVTLESFLNELVGVVIITVILSILIIIIRYLCSFFRKRLK